MEAVRKHAETIGDGNETVFKIEHGLGTTDTVTQMFNALTGHMIEADFPGYVPSEEALRSGYHIPYIETNYGDHIVVAFASPPKPDSIRVVVLG